MIFSEYSQNIRLLLGILLIINFKLIYLQQIQCGYCGWLMAHQCENVLEHQCFQEYDETTNFLNFDENSA